MSKRVLRCEERMRQSMSIHYRQGERLAVEKKVGKKNKKLNRKITRLYRWSTTRLFEKGIWGGGLVRGTRELSCNHLLSTLLLGILRKER